MLAKKEIRDTLKSKREFYKNNPVSLPFPFLLKSGLESLLKKGKTIASYMPLPGELDMKDMHQFCLENGITLCFPFVVSDTEIVFLKVSNLEHFKPNAFGILEPSFVVKNVIVPDVFFVPALGFDNKGNRLGFGKGHYDRYFSRIDYQNRIKTGVCQSRCIVDAMPAETHDIKMDYILTEKSFKPVLQD